MEKETEIIMDKALPALSGSSLTYDAEKNVYLTLGYTSNAGNTYYCAIRISNHLVVYYELCDGIVYTFLNGIKLYAWDGQTPTLIAQKSWGNSSNWRSFSESSAAQESACMLKDYLASQAKAMGRTLSEMQLLDISRKMIQETQQKRLA